MIQMNLICFCDRVPCGAERSVRVIVSASQHMGGAMYENKLGVEPESLRASLEHAGWTYEMAETTSGIRRERILCPSHSEKK